MTINFKRVTFSLMTGTRVFNTKATKIYIKINNKITQIKFNNILKLFNLQGMNKEVTVCL